MVQCVCIIGFFGGVKVMLTYRAVQMGADAQWLSALAMAYAAPAALLAFQLGRYTDRVGGRRLAMVGFVAGFGAVALAALAPNLAVLVAAGAAIGLIQLFGMVAQQSMMAHFTPPEGQDRGFASLSAAAAIGHMIGPPVITYAGGFFAGPDSVAGVNPVAGIIAGAGFLVAGIAATLSIPKRTVRYASPLPRAESRITAASVLRTRGMGQAMLVGGVAVATLDLFQVFLPVWGQERGLSAAIVAWLLALRAAVTFGSRLAMPPLIRLAGRKVVLAVCLGLSLLALAALPLSGLATGAVLVAVIGFGLGLPQPITTSWVSRAARPGTRGTALGLRITTNRLAQIVLPTVVGVIAHGAGSGAVFWSLSGLLVAGTATAATADLDVGDGPEGDGPAGRAAPPGLADPDG